MSSIVVSGQIGQDHLREDGTPWPLVMVRGEDTYFADSAGDLIGYIVPGYTHIPDTEEGHDDALLLRWQTAVKTASDVQALLCADKAKSGEFDPAALSEDALNALLGDRTVPVEEIEEWTEEIPLVLVATDYEPFTERTPPTGNTLWVDPSDEVAFLHSLANLGLIEIYTHDEE